MKPVRHIKNPSSILVIITRRNGDVLLTTPMIRSLRLAWPEARIDALVFAGTEGVLANNTDLDQVITIARRPTINQHLRFLMHLWRSYDLALSMMPSDRPTFYAFAAAKYSVGLVPQGSKHTWKKWLLSKSAHFDNVNTHTVLMNLKLADLLGVPRSHEVTASWSAQDEAEVGNLLPFDINETAYAVMHVKPMYAYKAWKPEAWVELANWLRKRDFQVVLTGGHSADELAYIQNLISMMPYGAINLAARLSLSGVAYLLNKANVYIGPDTVVTHLAAAAGTPTVALFGPSNPVKWGPWPKGYNEDRNPYRMKGTQHINNIVLLQGGNDCVPCMEEGCQHHNASLSECLQNLPATKVIDAVERLLRASKNIES